MRALRPEKPSIGWWRGWRRGQPLPLAGLMASGAILTLLTALLLAHWRLG